MNAKVFLSHNHSDANLAKIIAEVIRRITLGQLDIWFSSDQSSHGGMRIGSVWIDEIRQQLSQSKAVIALLTATNSDSPWILFESGFGAAQANCEIIPLCVGINPSNVHFPLAMYQCYQVGDYESLKHFAAKLLDKYDIAFDEELVKPVLQKAISDLTESLTSNNQPKQLDLAGASNSIIQHIDRRFLEFMENFGSTNNKEREQKSQHFSYTITITINFPNFHREQFLQIENETTVQDIFDNIYFMLESHVKAFTYLEQWILVEKAHKLQLVIKEVQSLIPAKFIFSPTMHWEVIKLDKPYTVPRDRYRNL